MSSTCPPQVIDLNSYVANKYGLMSVARAFPQLEAHALGCGVTYTSLICPESDVWVDLCDSPQIKLRGPAPDVISNDPFVINASWACGVFGKTEAEHRQGALDALAWTAERSIEEAFYFGTAVDSPVLVGPGTTALNTAATPVSLAAGIGMLEAMIGQTMAGVGTIHLPRELGDIAARYHQTFGSGGTLYTALGTPIAFGTGYGNVSPAGVPAPDGVVWIYGTGPVFLALGEPFMNPPSFQDAIDRTNNELFWMAEQQVLLSVDGCGAWAVAVSLVEDTGGGGGGGTGRPACDSVTVDPHVQRQTGAGNVVVPAGARSVSITVLAGDVSLAINGDAAVLLPAGLGLSWGVDDCSQTLADSFTFTNDAGGDDFIVNWTT